MMASGEHTEAGLNGHDEHATNSDSSTAMSTPIRWNIMASIGVNPEPPSGLAGRSSKLRPSFVRLSVKGALGQWALVMSRMGAHLWLECLVPLVLNLPLLFMIAFLIFFGYINDWNRETWSFVTAAVAFLLTQKLSLAYARFWEARDHLGAAVRCCRSILVMVKPRLEPDHHIAAEAADDVRRYCMLYYWTMCFQLLGMDSKQAVVMHHLKDRPEEEELLFKRTENQALVSSILPPCDLTLINLGPPSPSH